MALQWLKSIFNHGSKKEGNSVICNRIKDNMYGELGQTRNTNITYSQSSVEAEKVDFVEA